VNSGGTEEIRKIRKLTCRRT